MSVQTESVPAVMFSPRRIGHANLFVGELEQAVLKGIRGWTYVDNR